MCRLCLQPHGCDHIPVGTVCAQSKVDVTFWSPLGEHKLHTLQLGEGPVPLRGHFAANSHPDQPGLLTVTAASLPEVAGGTAEAEAEAAAGSGALPSPASGFGASGELYVLNTAERILHIDRKAAVQQVREGQGSLFI